MRLHKTGHAIADTVSDLIGELPDGDYKIAYGILRHRSFDGNGHWFEVDKGLWGADHYSGMYRLSYRGTQPRYSSQAPHEAHGQTLDSWREGGVYSLICPPTEHVCHFFDIDPIEWLWDAIRKSNPKTKIRYKGDNIPINWDEIKNVITFNSTVGFEALRRGIEVISNPTHSTIGSYTQEIGSTIDYDRNPLLEFAQAHQFHVTEKEKICNLINYYLSKSSSDTTAGRQ